MSTSMPEFEMPAAVEPPPRPRAAPTTVRPAHTAEPDASDDPLEPPRRGGPGWRQLLVAGVVGAIIGAAIPGGIEIGERAAANADEASLRAVATEYLAAIAEGRAADATALVPLPARAEGATDAVLQSAERIDEAAVQFVRIDGDAGSVEVRYSIGAIEAARTLDAERVAGQWWLTTSLAEQVEPMYWGQMTEVTLAGFELVPGRRVHLYPGLYAIDEVTGPVMEVRSERFSVDGDAATMTEVFVEAQLTPQVGERASALGLALAAQCQASESCEIAPELELQVAHAAVFGAERGTVDVSVQLMTDEINGQWFEARVRIVTDDDGDAAQWLCAPIGDYGIPSEPCPELP